MNRTLPRAYENDPDNLISWLQKSTQATAARALRGFEPRLLAVDPVLNPRGVISSTGAPDALRLLSYNIQVGITTRRFRQYVTKGWKHVLPHEARDRNLRRIADVVAEYDVVALQEIDSGSLRSGFLNQVEYLAHEARFPYWYAQLNRDLGPLAQHGNGLLSRVELASLEDHKLPGRIPGRGAIVMRCRLANETIVVVLLHLSLGERSRQLQLKYVRDLIDGEPRVVVMGDMNSHLSDLLNDSPLSGSGLCPAANVGPTYPAWRPLIALDHVLTTPTLAIKSYTVLDHDMSDHRPLAVTIGLQDRM